MIEGYNNKIPLYNGLSKSTLTSTPSFIYFGGTYFNPFYPTNIFKYNLSSLVWSKKYDVTGGTSINAVCADLSGYVWAAADNKAVIKYDSDGNALIYGTSSSLIYSMDSDSQNNIVLCGTHVSGSSIYKYDTNFNQIWSFGTGSGATIANFNRLNITTSGDIIASAPTGTVVRLNKNGTCLMSKDLSASNVYSSCVDSDGNIWIGLNGGTYNLLKHDSNGNLLSSYYIGPGTEDIVFEIAGGESGYIYVVSNAYLYKVSTTTGSVVWSKNPGAPINTLYGRCLVYKNGYICFLSNSTPTFKMYNTSGSLVTSFGVDSGTSINVQPI